MSAVQDAGSERSPSTDPPSPAHLGRYRLLDAIGQGGMARVMVAVMPGPARFNKLLVIKTIREDVLAGGPQYAHMFLDEARLAARLNHQNVVQTYEVGEEKGLYYIAMEYLEGQALRHVQQKIPGQGLPLEARLRIVIDTAQGLHHAHELTDFSGKPLHVVHRDVSPQNIFLTYDGQVKLLDFGIAKTCDAEVVTTVGQIKGKIDYMAPEQVKGDNVDRRADVFALGAIMWELLADKPLSGGGSVNQMTRVHNRVANRELSVGQVVPKLDPELVRICDKALAHLPEDRYATALDFATDLQVYLSERSLVPTAQQLAEILGPAFSKERKASRQRIEDALATVEHDYTQSCSMEIAAATSEPPVPTLAPPGRRRQSDGMLTSESVPIDVTPRRVTMVARLATLGVAMAVAAWLALGSKTESEVPTAASQRTSSAERHELSAAPSPEPVSDMGLDPPVELAKKETVRLRVSSPVPGVTVTLDGAALPALPFEAEVTKGNAIHQIVASAPGHQALTQVVIFDRDREVELHLPGEPAESTVSTGFRGRKKNRARAIAPSSATDAPVQPSDKTIAPTPLDDVQPGQKVRHQANTVEHIDDEDPYL